MPDASRAVRCAIYTRQSVSRAGTELSSCMVQRELCEKYIGAHLIEGWVVLAERFDDEGVSGATVERAALARLLRRVEAGEVDRVVTYRLDRITRSLVDWANLLAIFRRHDVRLSQTCGELGESEVATSDFILNMLAAFADVHVYRRERWTERERARMTAGLAGRIFGEGRRDG